MIREAPENAHCKFHVFFEDGNQRGVKSEGFSGHPSRGRESYKRPKHVVDVSL
jgi:hypothetical protein